MSLAKKVQSRNKKPVKKQDWLHAALEMLVDGGIESVRIERLAANLDVSKSGFYYHFRGTADLHSKMLSHWVALDHTPIFELPNKIDSTPAELLADLAEIVDRENLSKFDSAIRQWGRLDPKVERVWREEMEKRFSVIRNFFAALGFTGEDLEMRAHLYVGYHLTEREVFPDLSSKERARFRDLRMRLLLSP